MFKLREIDEDLEILQGKVDRLPQEHEFKEVHEKLNSIVKIEEFSKMEKILEDNSMVFREEFEKLY